MPTAERALPAGFSENLDEQVRTAVDDLGMLPELGSGIDHAEQLQHLDPCEVAACGFLHEREELQPYEPRVVIGLLYIDVLAHLPVRMEPSGSRGPWPAR